MSQTVFIVTLETDDGVSSIHSVKATEEAAEKEVQELASRLREVTPSYEIHEVDE